MAVATDPILTNAAVFLTAAVVGVIISRRAQLGSILGYLGAGALIGPFGLRLTGDAAETLHFAEFGVVLLLFVIGLELQPRRLWRMRTEIFGLGALQVALTGAVLAMIVWLGRGHLGLEAEGAILVGMALALSSTAFAIQVMRDKGELTSPYGDRAFSVLLFQDLAIVPLLALASILAPGAESAGDATEAAEAAGWLWDAALGIGALAALLLVGHYGLRPLFHLIATTGAEEVFTAAALLVVIAASLAMQWAGLSMALGAFLAGLLLAESEFRHQLEADIEPFRGLFLGLFFISIGMSVDWGAVWANLALAICGALGILAIKALLLYGLCRAFGSNRDDAMKIGATLAQGGEFAFVLFAVSSQSGLIPLETSALLTAVVAMTMALTPGAIAIARRLAAREDKVEDMEQMMEGDSGRVIIAGFGRTGQVVGRILRLRGHELTLIDNSPRRIRMAESFGSKVFFGDGRRLDVLRTAGAADAKAIFLCINDREGARQAVERLREAFPKALVLANTYDRFSELEMREAGVDFVIREAFESAIHLAAEGLSRIGDAEIIDEVIDEFRREDLELLRLQSEYGAHGGLEKMREKYSLQKGVATKVRSD